MFINLYKSLTINKIVFFKYFSFISINKFIRIIQLSFIFNYIYVYIILYNINFILFFYNVNVNVRISL